VVYVGEEVSTSHTNREQGLFEEMKRIGIGKPPVGRTTEKDPVHARGPLTSLFHASKTSLPEGLRGHVGGLLDRVGKINKGLSYIEIG